MSGGDDELIYQVSQSELSFAFECVPMDSVNECLAENLNEMG